LGCAVGRNCQSYEMTSGFYRTLEYDLSENHLDGVVEVLPDPKLMTWLCFVLPAPCCQQNSRQEGLNTSLRMHRSILIQKGTCVGFWHYQAERYAETKLRYVCTKKTKRDLRRWPLGSEARIQRTFLQWVWEWIDRRTNRRRPPIPKAVHTAFLNIWDETEVFYQISEFPNRAGRRARGCAWNDPGLGKWSGRTVEVISDRESNLTRNFRVKVDQSKLQHFWPQLAGQRAQ